MLFQMVGDLLRAGPFLPRLAEDELSQVILVDTDAVLLGDLVQII